MKGREPTDVSVEYERLIIAVRQASLGEFWSRETGTIRGNLIMLRKMGMMDREELGLEDWFPRLGTYPLKDEVGMGVAQFTLRMSLSTVRCAGHLQWDSMSKAL